MSLALTYGRHMFLANIAVGVGDSEDARVRSAALRALDSRYSRENLLACRREVVRDIRNTSMAWTGVQSTKGTIESCIAGLYRSDSSAIEREMSNMMSRSLLPQTSQATSELNLAKHSMRTWYQRDVLHQVKVLT